MPNTQPNAPLIPDTALSPSSPPSTPLATSTGNSPRTSDYAYAALYLIGMLSPIVPIWAFGHYGTEPYYGAEFLDPYWGEIFFVALLTWMVAPYPLIILHEFAHAIAAWLTGMKVNRIAIGRGRTLFKIPIGEMFVHFNHIPLGGKCYSTPLRNDGRRWRTAVMIAAGPLAHIAVLAAVFCVWNAQGWSLRERFTTGSTITLTLFFVNFFLLILNLIPRNTSWNGTPLRTDGGQLFDLFHGHHPTQSLQLLISLGDEGKWNEVQSIARATLRQQPPPPLDAIVAINAWLAVADVYVGGEDNLKEADHLSTRCFESSPGEPAILTVRACVLLALHRNDEAEKLLTIAQSGTLNPYAEKAAAHLWTELHRRKNNPDQMHHWLQIAQKLDPTATYKILRDSTPTRI